MRRFVSICVLFFGILALINAQRPGGGEQPEGGKGNMPKIGILNGEVYDADTEQAMDYVNLVLFSMRDSAMISGTVTVDGKFEMKELPFGRFYIVTNFMGYRRDTIRDIKINPKQQSVDLGKIKLKSTSTQIQGVEVVADKQHVEYRIDKKVVNVSQDLSASGGTAIEALENIPSVEVDIEGNVSLRGSGSFTVLIDGRPSVLQGSDALQQIPAESIEQIEIITNPSAKYDPDGISGIINVIMKKQKTPGYNLIFNGSVGTGDKYTSSLLLSYKTGNFNIFGGIDYNNRKFTGEGYTENETYRADTTFYRISDTEREMQRDGYSFKAGFDWYTTDKSILSFSGKYGNYGFGLNGNTEMWSNSYPVTRNEYLLTETSSRREGKYYTATLDYLQKFKGEQHDLEVMLYFSQREGDDRDEQYDYITDADWNIIDPYPESIRTSTLDFYNQLRIKADYRKSFGLVGKLEAGYQSRFDFSNEKYMLYDYDYTGEDWIINDEYSSEIDITRKIHSIYGIYSGEWNGFGYQAGLRGEYTDRRIESQVSEYSFIIDRFDFFPTIHFSKQITDVDQVLLSYSRRIKRPRGRELDPFPSPLDSYNVRAGNPELEPEYIDSYELSYQRRFNKSFVSVEAYYRQTKNKITRIKTLQPDGIMLHTYDNLFKDHALGTELMANLNLAEWLLINGSVNLYYYALEGDIDEQEVDDGSLTWRTRLNAQLKFKGDWRVQLTGMYNGPSVSAQGKREGSFMSNVAVRKDLLKKKLSLTLSGRDLFRTAKREGTSSGEGFYSYDRFYREAPVITLSFSLKINNYSTQKKDRESNDGMMEMDSGDFEF